MLGCQEVQTWASDRIEIDVQQLAHLVLTNKMEPLREVAAADAPGHDLQKLIKEASREKINGAKDESPDEPLKDIAADDATDQDLQGLAKEAGLGEPNKKEVATEDSNRTEKKLREAAAQKDVTADEATGRDMRKLSKETGLEDVNLNLPCRRNLRSKKKTKKVGSH